MPAMSARAIKGVSRGRNVESAKARRRVAENFELETMRGMLGEFPSFSMISISVSLWDDSVTSLSFSPRGEAKESPSKEINWFATTSTYSAGNFTWANNSPTTPKRRSRRNVPARLVAIQRG